MDPKPGIRIFLLTILVLAGFGTLLSRLHDFQITRHDHYQEMVPGDRKITVREPGIRGAILDRNGVELARNRRNYEVYFDLEEIYNAYRNRHEQIPERDILTSERGMPRTAQETDIVRIVNEWIIPKLDELGVAKNYNASKLRTHFITHRGLVPFSYNSGLDYDQFARLAEHSVEIPGVYLGTRPEREYPYRALASHILGYTQQWSAGDIPEDEDEDYDHYIGDEKGKAGIEATFNDRLSGPPGSRILVKNDRGKIVGMDDYRRPEVGAEVTLTIDARVQHLVSNVLRRAGRAAAVVMDVRTGEILAMASVPDYNPNDFIPSIDSEVWQDYTGNPSSPLTDRSISGFEPGSTLKLATAVTGVLNGFTERSYHCSGKVSYGDYEPRCWKRSGHGSLNLSEAIQRSCNPYFYRLSNHIGGQRMVAGMTMLGFGQPTGIRLPNESGGMFAGSQTWRRAYPDLSLSPATLAQLSIGQGTTLATPLQICAMTACLANGGRYYKPRVVKSAVLPNGTVLVEDRPTLHLDLVQEGLKPSDLELVRQGMWKSANELGGTGGRASIPDVEVAAKTGTAQTTHDGESSYNAWTVAFAPYDEPRYAVSVVVAKGESGGLVAGPLVHLILRGIFAADEGLKLPLTPLDPVRGDDRVIEEIELPEDVMAVIETGDIGETGDETGNAMNVQPAVDLPEDEAVMPEPAVTPEADEEGTVVPRALPVEEDP